jgi:hypothetical protein
LTEYWLQTWRHAEFQLEVEVLKEIHLKDLFLYERVIHVILEYPVFTKFFRWNWWSNLK